MRPPGLPSGRPAEKLGPADHPPRILLLYGSLRPTSYSRLMTEEAARLLRFFGAEPRIFDPSDLRPLFVTARTKTVESFRDKDSRTLAPTEQGLSLANPLHIAIYLGNGQMIAAPRSGTTVSIRPVYTSGLLGAVRVLS